MKRIDPVNWNREDRDLLVELKTEMSGLRDDVKELKDGIKSDIEFLKADKISRADAVRMQTDSLTRDTDYETRLRFIERYMWLALGGITILTFVLNYFHPFSNIHL